MPMQDPEVRVHNFSEVELGYDFELAFNEIATAASPATIRSASPTARSRSTSAG